MDMRVPTNRLIAAAMLPVAVLYNEFIVAIGKLRDKVLYQMLDIKKAEIQRVKKRRATKEKSYPENSF